VGMYKMARENIDDLAYISAHEALQRFREGSLLPVQVMEALYDRYKRYNDQINCVAYEYWDQAIDEAIAAGKRYENNTARPLEGIAVAIKDEVYIKGQKTSNGSIRLCDQVAKVTDPVPERLLAAGAIVALRTTTPEMSCSPLTWSNLWGVTRNPWNTAITPGGSSGGSAAALTAGFTTLANGSDSGGSLRIPGSQCGLYGVKASYGRIPEAAPFNADPYCHQGVITRDIEDARLMYNVVAGPHMSDPASDFPFSKLTGFQPDLRGKRIAVSYDFGFFQLEPDVRRNFQNLIIELEKQGAVVTEVDIAWDKRCIDTAITHQYSMMGKMLVNADDADHEHQAEDTMTDYYRIYLEGVKTITDEVIKEANEYAQVMAQTMERVFAEHDVFLCPAVCSTKVKADHDTSSEKLFIDGVEVHPVKGWFTTYIFNTLSDYPVISAPNGFADNGVPTGVQVVAPKRQEKVAFDICAGLGKVFNLFINQKDRPHISATELV